MYISDSGRQDENPDDMIVPTMDFIMEYVKIYFHSKIIMAHVYLIFEEKFKIKIFQIDLTYW